MAGETEVSPDQSSQQLSVSALAEVVTSFEPGARVQALPEPILRPLLVSLWQAHSEQHLRMQQSPVAELTLSRDALEAVKASPLVHVLADLAAGELAVYVADVADPTPALFYDQKTAIAPLMLSDDEAFFVEMHPPTGDPITTQRTPITALPETTPASAIADGFESAIPRGDPAALDSVLEAYAGLPSSTPVDVGYLLTLAGSCTGIRLRSLGEWSDREGLFSLDAAHRRKRKLQELDVISIEKEPTGQQGNNVDRIELRDDPAAPESQLDSDLVSLSCSLRDEW
jgi:hypothetical protein